MRFRKRERDDPRPELTSLVDIMFILIIFLSVTTTFATTSGIAVKLPQAQSQRPPEAGEQLMVVIDARGAVYLEGKVVGREELLARFRSLAQKRPDALVVIQADRHTAHGQVVAVMDLAQAGGLSRLAIATESPPETETKPTPSPPSLPASP